MFSSDCSDILTGASTSIVSYATEKVETISGWEGSWEESDLCEMWDRNVESIGVEAVACLDLGSYDLAEGQVSNLLGRVGYEYEEFFSESGKPDTAQPLLWAQISQKWFQAFS
ncbi:phosphorylase superfamily protein [Actinidia rufa]|uniref:Phosphorylase superfamily protein n=1 Tax=Actinidia rufa TaxID=165716 RepID=A0A7J0GKB6_9ERIC|nr:phosphorylase superfamily protein [Actinidia rufa]